jgi:hypothetical protein
MRRMNPGIRAFDDLVEGGNEPDLVSGKSSSLLFPAAFAINLHGRELAKEGSWKLELTRRYKKGAQAKTC